MYGATGSYYSLAYRGYDPRIGRLISVDPLTKSYPWYTPYQFAGNTPITFVDYLGLQPVLPMEQFIIRSEKLLGKVESDKIIQQQGKMAIEGAKIVGGFTPIGPIIDAYDFSVEAKNGSWFGMGIAVIGFLPFGDFAKIPGKFISITSDIANARHLIRGWDAPYKAGKEVLEFTTEGTEQFVRVFKSGENSAEGAWMMKKTDLLDTDGNMLSPTSIKNKFSLDYVPDRVVDVNVPGQTKMITGEAAGRQKTLTGTSTEGGGRQFELDQDIPSESFVNERSIEKL